MDPKSNRPSSLSARLPYLLLHLLLLTSLVLCLSSQSLWSQFPAPGPVLAWLGRCGGAFGAGGVMRRHCFIPALVM